MGSTYLVFSAGQAAAALWRYAEDDLVDRALRLTDHELRQVWTIAGSRWREDHGLPLASRLVPDKAIAFACIEFFEGRVRPLRRERRRPATAMPAELRDAPPAPPDALLDDLPSLPARRRRASVPTGSRARARVLGWLRRGDSRP